MTSQSNARSLLVTVNDGTGRRALLQTELGCRWPPYADYQRKTERAILVVLDPVR